MITGRKVTVKNNRRTNNTRIDNSRSNNIMNRNINDTIRKTIAVPTLATRGSTLATIAVAIITTIGPTIEETTITRGK